MLNVRNDDYKSILYCISAAILKDKIQCNRTRSLHYNISSIGCKNVNFPTSIDDIPRLEDQNRIMINIYVFIEEENAYKRIYASSRPVFTKEVNLLMVEKNETTKHFILIKNIRLLIKNKTRSDTYCKGCLTLFTSLSSFQSHLDNSKHCSNNNTQNILLPEILKKRRGILRILCDDSVSLQWSIVAALHPRYDTDGSFCTRTSPYHDLYHKMNFADLTFNNIPQNIRCLTEKLSVNINVFTYKTCG